MIYFFVIEIFGELLIGSIGGNFGYDFLVFVIGECYKCGMELYVWIVMIFVGNIC